MERSAGHLRPPLHGNVVVQQVQGRCSGTENGEPPPLSQHAAQHKRGDTGRGNGSADQHSDWQEVHRRKLQTVRQRLRSRRIAARRQLQHCRERHHQLSAQRSGNCRKGEGCTRERSHWRGRNHLHHRDSPQRVFRTGGIRHIRNILYRHDNARRVHVHRRPVLQDRQQQRHDAVCRRHRLRGIVLHQRRQARLSARHHGQGNDHLSHLCHSRHRARRTRQARRRTAHGTHCHRPSSRKPQLFRPAQSQF